MAELRDILLRFDLGAWGRRHAAEIVLGLGAAARLRAYLADRAPWLDEGSLAANILGKSAPSMFGPLDHGQLAPAGFLLLERAAATSMGGSTMALRLLPLLGGVASLVLALAVARRALGPRAVAVFLALMASSNDLIYYASELKPYSTDVAVGLAILGMGLALADRPLTAPRLLAGSAAGAAAVWFSFPAAFAMAGVGASLMASALAGRRRRRAGLLLAMGLAWAASILACRAVGLRQLGDGRPAMEAFWGSAFWPLPPRGAGDLLWAPRRFLYLFVNPLDFSTPLGPAPSAIPAACLCALGAIAIVRRSPVVFGMLALPGLFAMLASGFHAYPFHGRMVLFLCPALLLMIAEGCEQVRLRLGPAAWALALAAVLLGPSLTALSRVVDPRVVRDFNPRGDLRPPSLDPDAFPFGGREGVGTPRTDALPSPDAEGRFPFRPSDQGLSGETTSPPARVPSAHQTLRLIESLTARVEPSA